MPENLFFLELVRRIRTQDEQAAAELVRRYEPALRVAVRVRLTDARLRRILDSGDICQDVLGELFVRLADGQFTLEQPEQLLRLLRAMARNRVTNEILKLQAARRDVRRVRGAPPAENLADPAPTPSRQAENRELVEALHNCLSDEEWQVAEQRAEGRGWAEIAAGLGSTADALRIRFRRTANRVAHELNVC